MSQLPNELSESALTALASRERTRVVAPLTEWRTLAPQLRAEGIIRAEESSSYERPFERPFVAPATGNPTGDIVPRRHPVMVWGTRLVASVLLLGMGIGIGRGMTLGNQVVRTVQHAIAEQHADSAVQFRSSKDAMAALVRAQSQYQRASAYLAARDTTAQIVGDPEIYQARLAVLDEMLATTGSQLHAAPADPVLNQYYQSAVGARQATIQQLGRTLPAGVRLAHY